MYRKEDIEAINLNIDNIKDEAEYECRTKNDPTLEEMSNVYGDIMDYIRKNNIIAYGGFAQNLLIGVKDKEKVDKDVKKLKPKQVSEFLYLLAYTLVPKNTTDPLFDKKLENERVITLTKKLKEQNLHVVNLQHWMSMF